MTEFLDGPKGRIAYNRATGRGRIVVFLGGFRSDTSGAPRPCFEEWARAGGGRSCADYSGHGESDGGFLRLAASATGLADAAVAIDALTEGRRCWSGRPWAA